VRDRIWEIMRHQRRGYLWLAGRTGYSHSHIKAVASGVQQATPEFRAKCAFALDLPESFLFHAARAPEGAAAQS
jgi:transcriptional regulator with XRE-family HTH domain